MTSAEEKEKEVEEDFRPGDLVRYMAHPWARFTVRPMIVLGHRCHDFVWVLHPIKGRWPVSKQYLKRILPSP